MMYKFAIFIYNRSNDGLLPFFRVCNCNPDVIARPSIESSSISRRITGTFVKRRLCLRHQTMQPRMEMARIITRTMAHATEAAINHGFDNKLVVGNVGELLSLDVDGESAEVVGRGSVLSVVFCVDDDCVEVVASVVVNVD